MGVRLGPEQKEALVFSGVTVISPSRKEFGSHRYMHLSKLSKLHLKLAHFLVCNFISKKIM